MLKKLLLLIFILLIPSIIQCDLTNLNDILAVTHQNQSKAYPVGFLSKANSDVVKRYLLGNIEFKFFADMEHLLQAVDNETVIAGVSTGQYTKDLEPRFHIFSSLIISPLAMLLAPDYNENSTPYGLKNQSSNDLFNALNAAIGDVQREGVEETLLTIYNRTDLVRVYTCHQDSQLPVVNRNETTGYLRDILYNKSKILIGGLGPYDWGVHDGNYNLNISNGFYPKLLDAIIEKFRKLKGPDEIVYGDEISFQRIFFPNATLLFQALLDGKIHATDVYLLIDAPYTGSGESCLNDSVCRSRETCVDGNCAHPARPRSLHFRTTCTTTSRDTKFITKKNSKIFKTSTEGTVTQQTPKTRWIGFLLLFTALFGTIFLTLVILTRRKKHYRVEHTLRGGFGKFARLQEESEPPIEAMDAFDDHILQSPRDNTNSTS